MLLSIGSQEFNGGQIIKTEATSHKKMPQNTEEQYRILKKKYDLPPFEELDREFDIGGIDESAVSSKIVVKKMIEKIDFFSKIFEEIIQPDTNPASLHECSIFEDPEKMKILEIYKKLYYYNRSYVELELVCEEKKFAEYIKWLHDEWKHVKPKILPIIQKLKKSWLKDTDTKTELEYFG